MIYSATQMAKKLERKGVLWKEKDEENQSRVFLRLTEKGERAFHHHADFHTQMTDAVIRNLEKDELPVLMKTLNALSVFFRNYHEEI